MCTSFPGLCVAVLDFNVARSRYLNTSFNHVIIRRQMMEVFPYETNFNIGCGNKL